jgi:outer membrane protein assembly factor BamD (BamD/ComL family)
MQRKILTTFLLLGMFVVGQGCANQVEKIGQDQVLKVNDLPPDLAEVAQKLQQDRPKKAYKLVKKWIKKNKDSEENSQYMDQALFFKGQALFERKLYYQAFEAYDEMLDGYGGSSLFEAAINQEVEIARRFLAGAKRKVWGFIPSSARTEGLEILDRVVERWPGSELAARALTMQAEHYYHRGRFIEAQSTYQVLVEHYSKSNYYPDALLRNAEATQAQYEGPLYDSGCLTDALIRYEHYQARFPIEAQELGIRQRMERINWQQAQKHYKIADYYRRTHRSEAAQFYGDYIRQQWPDSVWTSRVQEMLDQQK